MALNSYKILGQTVSSAKKVLSVSNYALTSNVATITTGKAHDLKVGDLVLIQAVANSTFNGIFAVLAVPTTTTFTFNKTASNISSTAASAGTVTAATSSQGAAISGRARTDGYATITTSTNHNLAVGDVIYVTHGTDTSFDGYYVVDTVPSATTFTYLNPGSTAASAAATGAIAGFQPQAVYTVPAGREAIVSTINVCNTNANSAIISIYAVPSGGSATDSNKLYESATVVGNETVTFTIGLALGPGESVRYVTSANGLVITATGSELS